jgi:hypothetical protein
MSALHAMRTDRSPLTRAYGRHSAIPNAATDNGNGTSTFSPPGLTGVTWIFNNSTGLITQICSTTCSSATRWLLSGYVAFATGAAPTSTEAEAPVDDLPTGVTLSMGVTMLEPIVSPVTCAVGTVTGQALREYYCALPTVNSLQIGRYWSGRIDFSSLPLSTSLSDTTVGNYKVCRYTPETVNVLPTPPATLPTVPADQTVGDYNSRHPYIYYRVNGSLQNKNFLVISAGDGTVYFGCPTENSSTPIESNTLPHQPIS